MAGAVQQIVLRSDDRAAGCGRLETSRRREVAAESESPYFHPMTGNQPVQLPDDIEQKLIDGQRFRATADLMERRGISLNAARTVVGRWLFERQQAAAGLGAVDRN